CRSAHSMRETRPEILSSKCRLGYFVILLNKTSAYSVACSLSPSVSSTRSMISLLGYRQEPTFSMRRSLNRPRRSLDGMSQPSFPFGAGPGSPERCSVRRGAQQVKGYPDIGPTNAAGPTGASDFAGAGGFEPPTAGFGGRWPTRLDYA